MYGLRTFGLTPLTLGSGAAPAAMRALATEAVATFAQIGQPVVIVIVVVVV